MKRNPPIARAVALCVLFLAALSASAAQAAYIIDEDFEGVYPPSGWNNPGCDRKTNPPDPARSLTHSVLINAINDSMKTPLLPNPGTLTFYFNVEDVSSQLTVEYSTTAGGLWEDIPGSPFSAPNANAWIEVVVGASSRTNIYLKFRLNSKTTPFNIYIDDVSVTATESDATPTPTPAPTTSPAPVHPLPSLALGMDFSPDPLCDTCTRLGLSYSLTPTQPNGEGVWDPRNQVDPYVAVQITPEGGFPGPLLFFHNGNWYPKVQPVYRGFVIGEPISGVLGVFLLGPSLPSGTYTIYGVLNTPGAPVWKQRYWSSELTTFDFQFPLP